MSEPYWTTGRQPPLTVYDNLDNDDLVLCIIYGIKRNNGNIDIDLNPLIGGKVENSESPLNCFYREMVEETGLNLVDKKYSKTKISTILDKQTNYFIIKF